MITDTLYALLNLAHFYCIYNAGWYAAQMVKRGQYLLPFLGVIAVVSFRYIP
jgi:hypothetical protein